MKKILAYILVHQARRFIKKTSPFVIVVSGSVGKTTSTQAIATVLETKFKVRKTIKNYNSELGVPCSIFKREIPTNLYNPFAWLYLFVRNELSLIKPAYFDMLVLELGTDKVNELSQYSWLKPDLAVVTAVAPEHMQNFTGLDAVAKEELSVAKYSYKTLINEEMIAKKYWTLLDDCNFETFNTKIIKSVGVSLKSLNVYGKHSYQAVAAAVSVCLQKAMTKEEIKNAVVNITPQNGRMNMLEGIEKSTLIDDTYNSSPEAVIAALDYLCSLKNRQRIALLGNMNELGSSSRSEHLAIGEYCDPDKIDIVITLGKDANEYTARAAKAKGCRVFETNTPYEAAKIIKSNIRHNAAVLFKGSQNGVFAEEAVKQLLMNPEDEKYLVRQSIFWKTKKIKAFGGSG